METILGHGGIQDQKTSEKTIDKRRKQTLEASETGKKKQEEGGQSFEQQKTLLTSVAGFISQRTADNIRLV